MESKEVLELITALVDNEIETKEKAKEIKSIIENNQELYFEYQIQNFIKTTINTRVQKTETPEYLRNRIINNIISEADTGSRKNLKTKLIRWIFNPVFGFAVFLLVFFLLFLFYTSNNYKNIALQQNGKSNMFNRALQNFQNIIDGNLSAQLYTSNIEELKTFFKDRGVSYEANLPLAKDWKLSGAAVSEINGKKLVHNIYRNSSGKLAYLFQANENVLNNHSILNLSDDLLKLVNAGKCYRYKDNNKSVIVWKCKKNVCILVSNDQMDKLDQFTASR